MSRSIPTLMILVMILALAPLGCAPKLGGNDYSASSAGVSQRVQTGIVTSVRSVRINDDDSSTVSGSTAVGAVAGGVLGNLVGHGGGRVAATVGGALLGAAAGNLGSKAAVAQNGYEITVKLDGGGTVAITQGADVAFSTGQHVKILSGGGRDRVVPN